MVLDDALPIALVGLSGAGKSTVAPLIAARLGISAIDLDAAVEEAGGASVAALFVAEGEAAFRDREEKALERALQRGPCVIACGGGLVLRARARAALRARCRTVWLEVPPVMAAERTNSGGGDRPLLAGGEAGARLAELLEARAGFYAEVAAVRVATAGRSPAEVAACVCRALGVDEEHRGRPCA